MDTPHIARIRAAHSRALTVPLPSGSSCSGLLARSAVSRAAVKYPFPVSAYRSVAGEIQKKLSSSGAQLTSSWYAGPRSAETAAPEWQASRMTTFRPGTPSRIPRSVSGSSASSDSPSESSSAVRGSPSSSHWIPCVLIYSQLVSAGPASRNVSRISSSRPLTVAGSSVRLATEIISGTKSFAMSAMMAILPAEQGDVSAIVTNRSYPIRSPRLTPASSPFSRGFPWQAESRRHRQTVSSAASPRRKPFIHPFPLLN